MNLAEKLLHIRKTYLVGLEKKNLFLNVFIHSQAMLQFYHLSKWTAYS